MKNYSSCGVSSGIFALFRTFGLSTWERYQGPRSAGGWRRAMWPLLVRPFADWSKDPKPKNPPKDPKKDPRLIISLVLLLREIQNNATFFTRQRLRTMYSKKNRTRAGQFEAVADKDFNKVV